MYKIYKAKFQQKCKKVQEPGAYTEPDVQLKLRIEGVQDRRHRPRQYNTSTGTSPELTTWLTENLGHPTGE
ncbi:hypothetical protein Taro_005415, partial [Colocasia esculenta]|nr:hypothetical protein [Colocasia esculenta]